MTDTTDKKQPKLSPMHMLMAGRFIFILSIVIVLTCCIVAYMYDTTVTHRKDWVEMGDSTLARRTPLLPVRGEILASDGSILATNLRYYNVRIDLKASRFKIIEFDSLIPELSGSLAKLFTFRDSAGWVKHLRAGISVPKKDRSSGWSIAKKVTLEQANACRNLPFFNLSKNSAYTGLVIEGETVRSYPFGEMARLSIGRVGQTKECNEVRGRSGLECALDTLLFGKVGSSSLRLGTRGVYRGIDTPAVDGCDVTTTIDITTQDILEHELGEMLLECNADWGASMIMEVQTGDIKAISNLERDSNSTRPRYIPALNRIVQRFEPGSVMKVMTMAVALRYGYANLNQSYPIGRSYSYLGRKPITDTHSPATLTVRQFMTYSSNIGMCKLSMPQYTNNPNLFRERLATMGFFDRLGTGIAREIPPFFPMLQNNTGGLLNLSRMVFGYSTEIPPLYTCAFYNAVANDGKFVRPRLVKGLRTPDGRDSVIPTSYVREDPILTPTQAAQLRDMMHSVVWEEGGTARAVRNSIVDIAGKTGTAKVLTTKPKNWPENVPFRATYRDGHNRVTFCGFFPYENPRYTMIVVISDPQPKRGAAVTCGTVVKNVALKLYARGMLDENPQFQPEPQAGTESRPLVHTSLDRTRSNELLNSLHTNNARSFQLPARNYPAGQVPDVKGVNFREALNILEAAGYAVDFTGAGYVETQNPPAGTSASAGTKVHLTLKNLD